MKSIRAILTLVCILSSIAIVSLCINLQVYGNTDIGNMVWVFIAVVLYVTYQVVKRLSRITNYLNSFKKL